MEYDPTRMCELLVGLGDVEVLSVDDNKGEPLGVHVRCLGARPACGDCGGPVWSDGERAVVLVDLCAFGRHCRLVWHKRRWRGPRDGCEAGTVTEQAAQIAAAAGASDVARGAVGDPPGRPWPAAQRRRL